MSIESPSDALFRTREILNFARGELDSARTQEAATWDRYDARTIERQGLRTAIVLTDSLARRIEQLSADEQRHEREARPADCFVRQTSECAAEIVIRGLLDLVDQYGTWLSSRLLRQLDDIDQWTCGQLADVLMRIDSTGGSLRDALELFDALMASGVRVATLIDGEAASAAAMLALAGAKRSIVAHGRIMHHTCTFQLQGRYGHAELAGIAREAASANRRIAEILKARTRLTDAAIVDVLTRDVWFTAEEALAAGLVDEIVRD